MAVVLLAVIPVLRKIIFLRQVWMFQTRPTSGGDISVVVVSVQEYHSQTAALWQLCFSQMKYDMTIQARNQEYAPQKC